MGQSDQANNMDCIWVWITVQDQRDSAIWFLVVMAILLWTGTHILYSNQCVLNMMLMRCWCAADALLMRGRLEMCRSGSSSRCWKGWTSITRVEFWPPNDVNNDKSNLMGDGRKWCGNGVESNNSNTITLWHGFLKEHLRVFPLPIPCCLDQQESLECESMVRPQAVELPKGFCAVNRRKFGPSWAMECTCHIGLWHVFKSIWVLPDLNESRWVCIII